MLGHKDSTVTRRVYISEVRTIERSAKRRGRLEARMGEVLSSLSGQPSRMRAKSVSEVQVSAAAETLIRVHEGGRAGLPSSTRI